MAAHAPTARAPARRGLFAQGQHVVAGIVGSLSVLAVPLTLGLLVFAPLGSAATALGLQAAFACAAAGGIVYGLLGRTAVPAGGPSSATALILASVVARLAADPALRAGTPDGVLAIAALCAATVMASGLLQMVMALAGVARLARFVPQPVLGGFMNGVAVLILLAQLPLLLGQAPGTTTAMLSLSQVRPGAVALGLATAAVLWLASRRWPRSPTMLIALVGGTLVHYVATLMLAQASLGPRIGAVPDAMLPPLVLLARLAADGPAWLGAHAVTLGSAAVVLALIGALECALNNLALDQQCHTRHDPRRELLAVGCANLLCGALCALPVVALRARAMAIVQAGGRGRMAAVGGSLALGALYLYGTPLLAALPLPVLAGVMVVIGLTLIDRWSGRLLSQWWAGQRTLDVRLGLGVVLLVGLTTVISGFGAAVALGVLLSVMVFLARMNRSLVRHRCTAVVKPSRRIYPAAVEARLATLREQIVVLELEGALYFGSGERLLGEVETLRPDCSCLVLDLRRVSTIDETGAVVLQQLATRLHQRGIELLLAGAEAGSTASDALHAFGSGDARWPDVDRAVEAAERRLLGETPVATSVPLADCSLMQGLGAAQRAIVQAHLLPRELAAGESLFAEGDAADCLYLLTRGSLSIVSRADARGRAQRYLSISAGMMLGETAMLDGGGRSAGVVADDGATVFALHQASLDELTRGHPEVAARLYRNIAVHLSQRLRSAAAAWNASLR